MTVTAKEVLPVVKRVICEILGHSDVHLAQELDKDLGADSLDTVEIWMALEDEFGIDMPDEEIEPLKTVGQIDEYVRRKKAGLP